MTCEVDEACYGDCPECKAWESEIDVGEPLTQDTEEYFGFEYELEEDFLTGVTCNPDEPELCESCQ